MSLMRHPSLRSAGPVTLALVVVLLLAACTAGPNPDVGTPGGDGDVAGFWLGLWHGIIAPITFLISLFDNDVNFYEVHNNGNWYNVGFALGALLWIGSSGGSTAARSRRGRSAA